MNRSQTLRNTHDVALTTDAVLALFHAKVAQPATLRDLLVRLEIPKDQRAAFRRIVKFLLVEGRLMAFGHRHIGVPEREDRVRGRLTVHPQGFAFVVPERPIPGVDGDLYVASHMLGDAVHGDTVLARVDRIRADGKADGRILRIVERRAARIVGRARVDRAGLLSVEPFDKRLVWPVRIIEGGTVAVRNGDMVVADITRFPSGGQGPLGRLVEVLGPDTAPGVDTRIIIHKHGLADEHSEEAEREASRLGATVRERDLKGRTDFRGEQTVTIDGEHARDFDDAVAVDALPNGHFRLTVHIADVSHYVRPGDVLDQEAASRATSVYFPERALHMFPAALATGLCSLNPQVDRLVQSVRIDVDDRGEVVRYELFDGVIRSAARLTYGWVNSVLTGAVTEEPDPAVPLIAHIRRMQRLFVVLNERRRRRGSIDFDLPEPDVILDDEGRVQQILVAERNTAHRLIEEFMLLANETVAAHLTSHDVASLFRVHERPDPVKVLEFETFIATLGYTLHASPGEVTPDDFQRLVDRMRGKPEERAIALLMLRTMQKARYDPSDLGHFGLATRHYLHFTSPIRRYPDLIVHRTLRWLRQLGQACDELVDLADDLPDLARHASDMERKADEAERELVQWKKVRFMADKVGEEFDGYVTGIAPFGLFVELVEHFVEGLVHISTMVDDYYLFTERSHVLKGESSGRTFTLGDRIRVQVLRADLERRQVELGIVGVLDRIRTGRAKSRRQPSAKTARRTVARKSAKVAAAQARRAQRPGRRERQARKKGRG